MKTKLLAVAFAGLLLIAIGCSVEESEQGISGSVFVSLADTSGAAIERATIWVDGQNTSRLTPAVVSGLSTGSHVITVVRPDVFDAADTVVIAFQDTAHLALTTTFKPLGPVELVSAPDSTTLVLNNFPSGTTPPTVLYVGIGTYLASMYLPGHATDLPAQWTLTVTQNDTVHIPANFTALETGSEVERLAPAFDLPSDYRTAQDTTRYRLQDYRGKVLLLTFFYSDCAPCAAEMPYIQNVYEDPQYAGKIEFFGVDPQDPYFVFSQFRIIRHPELGLTFPLLFALQQGVKEAYNVIPFPTNIFIDQTGRVRFREAGVDEELIRNRIETMLAEAGD